MTDELPTFKYHPFPLEMGSIEPSDTECKSCGRVRDFVYVGPVYALDELDGQICPWCIADGSAHRNLDAEFTDPSGVGGYGQWDKVSEAVIQEVAYRTPGFTGWQQERWFTHHDDAAAFLGCAGRKELIERWSEAIESIKEEAGLDGEEWENYFQAMHIDHGPTAYVFRCLHCGEYGGYSDTH